jgi:3',5'-cyclic AMP phosphodiesterase CpdA
VLPQSAVGQQLEVRARGLELATALPTPPATLVATADIACQAPYETTEQECRHAETAALAEGLAPDAVALPGDIQYESGTMREFRGSFHPTWGQLRVPLRPVPGNHEYRIEGARDYFAYFEEQASWRPPSWYAYNLGPWHIVALNSNCERPAVPCGGDEEQVNWLRAELAADTHRCTLAYWHHPRYSSGFHGSDPRTASLWRILDQADAEIVLSGHDHHYERLAPQDENGRRSEVGMRQFVVGTGGSKPSVVREPGAPHSEYAQNLHFGVLRLRLYEDTYAWRFVALNGEALDRGAGSCL